MALFSEILRDAGKVSNVSLLLLCMLKKVSVREQSSRGAIYKPACED